MSNTFPEVSFITSCNLVCLIYLEIISNTTASLISDSTHAIPYRVHVCHGSRQTLPQPHNVHKVIFYFEYFLQISRLRLINFIKVDRGLKPKT